METELKVSVGIEVCFAFGDDRFTLNEIAVWGPMRVTFTSKGFRCPFQKSPVSKPEVQLCHMLLLSVLPG